MTLRIATWNCYRGEVQSRAEILWQLGADIAILQECGRPESEDLTCGWHGPRLRQGVAVVTKGEFYFDRACEPLKAGTYGISAHVRGPLEFSLLGLWSHVSRGRSTSYVRSVLACLDSHTGVLQRPAVVAGDFNSNAIWNGKRKKVNHATLVSRLADMGLVSAYHEFFGESHGAESRPTHYFLRDEARPFHLDYCFVPRAWVSAILAVEVGAFANWRDRSDHVPLIVELDLGALRDLAVGDAK